MSGTETDQRGSFLEMSWGWKQPFPVGDGERTALEDGDEVVLRYTAPPARTVVASRSARSAGASTPAR